MLDNTPGPRLRNDHALNSSPRHHHHTTIMQLTTLAYGLFALLVSQVSATALTYKLVANEKACFYANNQDKFQKIAFYFAVRRATCPHFEQ